MSYKNETSWDEQQYTLETIDKNRIKKFKKVMALIPDEFQKPWSLFPSYMDMSLLQDDELELKQRYSLLDVGCGNGSLHTLFHYDYQVYGLDFTKHFIDEAKEAHPGNYYVVHDACQPYPFSGFDVVICVELLEHVPSPYMVLENIYNALKPGGSAIVSTPNGLSREFRFNMRKNWKIPQSVFQYLTPTVMEGMIREIGGTITYSDWRAKYRLGHIYMRFRK